VSDAAGPGWKDNGMELSRQRSGTSRNSAGAARSTWLWLRWHARDMLRNMAFRMRRAPWGQVFGVAMIFYWGPAALFLRLSPPFVPEQGFLAGECAVACCSGLLACAGTAAWQYRNAVRSSRDRRSRGPVE